MKNYKTCEVCGDALDKFNYCSCESVYVSDYDVCPDCGEYTFNYLIDKDNAELISEEYHKNAYFCRNAECNGVVHLGFEPIDEDYIY